MPSLNDITQGLGYAVGAVTGGPTQVKLAAAAAKIRQDANEKVRQVGEKIGSSAGANVFESLASGARKSSSAETSKFINERVLVGDTRKALTFYGLLAVGALALFLFLRKR